MGLTDRADGSRTVSRTVSRVLEESGGSSRGFQADGLLQLPTSPAFVRASAAVLLGFALVLVIGFAWATLKASLAWRSGIMLAFQIALLVVNFAFVFPLVVVFLRRRCKDVSEKLAVVAAPEETHPCIAVIVPCYLPNERDIIEDTVAHILGKLESPGELELWVVYNTPEDIADVEARLMHMAARNDLPRGRRLVVVRIEGSKTKAENLNAVLPQITRDLVVIYDADHHPDPPSLCLLYEKLRRKDLDCVQGSTYIRNLRVTAYGRVVDAEFFVLYFMYLPAMKLLTRCSFFGGSNALWRRVVLTEKAFLTDFQTEDIDISVRALMDHRLIDFCPEARSGELAPLSLRCLWHQRLRWAVGWDQVALAYLHSIAWNPGISCLRRLGLAHVLYTRWFVHLASMIAGVVAPAAGFARLSTGPSASSPGSPSEATDFEPSVVTLRSVMCCFYVVMASCCVLESIFQTHHRGLESWFQVLFVILFMIAAPIYFTWQALLIVMSLLTIALSAAGDWKVTARSAPDHISVDKAVQRWPPPASESFLFSVRAGVVALTQLLPTPGRAPATAVSVDPRERCGGSLESDGEESSLLPAPRWAASSPLHPHSPPAGRGGIFP